MNEQLYGDVRDRSFKLVLYMTNDRSAADDIAQEVSIIFIREQSKIRKPFAWCIPVTRRQVYLYSRRKKINEIGIDKQVLEQYAEKLEEDEKTAGSFDDPNLKLNIHKYLSKEDRKIYGLFVKFKADLKKIASELGVSYNSAATRLYRMKRNLKARRLVEMGYLASREILDYNTNRNIVTFINTFIDKCLKDDLTSLHKYMEFIDQKDIPKIKALKNYDFEITTIDDRKYKLLLPYLDVHHKIKFVLIIFHIDKLNRIKIRKIEKKEAAMVKLKGNKREIAKLLGTKRSGIIDTDYKKAFRILKEKNRIDKIITTKDKLKKMKIELEKD